MHVQLPRGVRDHVVADLSLLVELLTLNTQISRSFPAPGGSWTHSALEAQGPDLPSKH